MVRKVWIICGVLSVILLGAVALRLSAIKGNTADSSSQNAVVAGAPVGGPFSLVNAAGESVTNNTFANKYKLIFFGFTWCPSVCPTELSKMADVLDLLGAEANKIAPLFITIDPERDTPAIMGEYTSKFDPRIIGLAGSRDQINTVLKSYKVYAAKVPSEDGNYTMDHSSFMYLMSPDDQLLTLYRAEEKPSGIVADLRPRLK